jgi:hypothetical protein
VVASPLAEPTAFLVAALTPETVESPLAEPTAVIVARPTPDAVESPEPEPTAVIVAWPTAEAVESPLAVPAPLIIEARLDEMKKNSRATIYLSIKKIKRPHSEMNMSLYQRSQHPDCITEK